jgi:hypothetical protein
MSNRGLLGFSGLAPLALCLLLAGCDVGTNAAIPDMPSFEHDILPLTLSRCVRCHGGGGMLNADPQSTNPTYQSAPRNGFFNKVDFVVANCTADAQGTPCHGLSYYAVRGLGNEAGADAGANGNGFWTVFFPLMPPSPAAQLTSNERALMERWIANPLP